MKKNLFFAIAMTALLFCTACRSLKDSASGDESVQPSKIGEELLISFFRNDGSAFMRLLPADAQKTFSEKDFKVTRESMVKELGKPMEYTFITNLKHPTFTVSIWKVRFERDNEDKTKKIEQEVIFKSVTGMIDKKETILSFNFL